ncbi:MAG TPA: aminodeoxychorismate/anthranilate synthase component II [Pirellulales bacterium]|nr:aminodeoxychorismate/anthranilate synthase component II [Pirellulales bacterium]
MLLLIDNYDSFVHNLARYFERLGQETVVVRNDAIDAAAARSMNPAAIVLSPGPCTPLEAGCSLDIVREVYDSIPILGVCLGHQAIAAALGGRVVRASEPMHGRASEIWHDGRAIFAEVPNPFTAGRYHSLVVEEETLPDELTVTARTSDGVVMALSHARRPVFGVQFHPESVLTECGYPLLVNFLRIAGLSVDTRAPSIDDERMRRTAPRLEVPPLPVTF